MYLKKNYIFTWLFTVFFFFHIIYSRHSIHRSNPPNRISSPCRWIMLIKESASDLIIILTEKSGGHIFISVQIMHIEEEKVSLISENHRKSQLFTGDALQLHINISYESFEWYFILICSEFPRVDIGKICLKLWYRGTLYLQNQNSGA